MNLITKYRPNSFSDVIGQDAVVRSLQTIIKKKDSQVFLFVGPHGTGKTSLSRLVAKAFGVDEKQIENGEIDAATHTGIDSMRVVQDTLHYRPFGDSGMRSITIDECHRLSANAWDSLLKVLEDPPLHVIWCFCTTDPKKIPKTLLSRCSKFELRLLNDKDLGELYDYVCEQEKITLPDDVADLLIKEAKGSPRQLLSNIVVGRTAKTKKEAAILLQTAIESDVTLEICRFVANGQGSWSSCMAILNKLEDDNFEGVRIIITRYLVACLKSAKTNDAAGVFLEKLDAFSVPYNQSEGIAPLLLSIGRAMFGG